MLTGFSVLAQAQLAQVPFLVLVVVLVLLVVDMVVDSLPVVVLLVDPVLLLVISVGDQITLPGTVCRSYLRCFAPS
jgi:TRAP-type C4-dicarboxylate transport system permease large subunit